MLAPPDGSFRIAAIVFGAAVIRIALRFIWSKSKARRQEIPMRLRNGIHVPWGTHERFTHHATIAFMVWLALIVTALIYRLAERGSL